MIGERMGNNLRAGNLVLSLSVALTFAALPVMAGSLSGGPAVGTSHSGGPSATGSTSHARTVSDTTASGSSKSEAGKMNAGSSHSESAYKGGSSMSGVKTPSPIGTYKKDEGKSETATDDIGKDEKKVAGPRKKAKPRVVEYKWKGHELKSKEVVNSRKLNSNSTK